MDILAILDLRAYRTLFVMHPKIRRAITDDDMLKFRNIDFINRIPYREMLSTIRKSRFVITDSGAIQRESFYLKKRCLIRQNYPFWPSLIREGIHILVEKENHNFIKGLDKMDEFILKSYPAFDDLGTGNAGNNIITYLIAHA